jgi:hypothetical protein
VYVQINQSTLFNTSVNVTIAFTIVFGECILDKVPDLYSDHVYGCLLSFVERCRTAALSVQGLASALANETFREFMASAGLPLTRATPIRAKPDFGERSAPGAILKPVSSSVFYIPGHAGVSVLEQAAQAGYPSLVYQPVQPLVYVTAQATPSTRELVLALSPLAGVLAVGELRLSSLCATERTCEVESEIACRLTLRSHAGLALLALFVSRSRHEGELLLILCLSACSLFWSRNGG